MMTAAVQFIAAALAVVALPGTIWLVVMTLAACLPARVRPARSSPRSARARIAAVVPAHDEEANVAGVVASLLSAKERAAREAIDVDVLVVADNCSDATADRARAGGAEVLERRDETLRGKGFALAAGFDHALARGAAAVMVVDADSRVDPELFVEAQAAFDAGASAVQTRYEATIPEQAVDGLARLRLARLAFFAFNVVRARGRSRLGLSAGLFGNGFGLRADVLRERPYGAHSIVEDLEFHLDLVERGHSVVFLDRVVVEAPLPLSAAGARTQRTRWEGGRIAMAARHLPRLALASLRRPRLVEPALDLALAPLGHHLLLALPGVVLAPGAMRWVALATPLGIAFHVAAAWVLRGARGADLAALAGAPWYVVRKLALLPATIATARRGAAWRRTERDPAPGPENGGP